MGRGHVRLPVLRHQFRWPTVCWPTSPPGWRPASTWCSSTPDCTFRETLQVRDQVERDDAGPAVCSIQPLLTVGQQDGSHGPRLFYRRPDQCCAMRKVEPLERALAGYDAWGAGVRRDETAARAIVA